MVAPSHAARAAAASSGASGDAAPPVRRSGVLHGGDLGVIPPGTRVVALADDPRVPDDDGAHDRVGAGAASAPLRQGEGPLEHQDVMRVDGQQKTPQPHGPGVGRATSTLRSSLFQTVTVGPGISPGLPRRARGLSPPVGNLTRPRRPIIRSHPQVQEESTTPRTDAATAAAWAHRSARDASGS